MENQCLDMQLSTFISILEKNKQLMMVLDYISNLSLPNFYIAAGSVFQTIWNYYDGNDLNCGIKDIDVIYYNPDDLSIDADLLYYEKIHSFVEKNHLPYLVDVSNEARMHLWKEKKEGVRVRPYRSSEDAISRWIATVHAVGITKSGNHLQVFAPYGLSDIFSRTIRPIKHEGNSKELYEKKANSWRQRFPNVHIVPW